MTPGAPDHTVCGLTKFCKYAHTYCLGGYVLPRDVCVLGMGRTPKATLS